MSGLRRSHRRTHHGSRWVILTPVGMADDSANNKRRNLVLQILYHFDKSYLRLIVWIVGSGIWPISYASDVPIDFGLFTPSEVGNEKDWNDRAIMNSKSLIMMKSGGNAGPGVGPWLAYSRLYRFHSLIYKTSCILFPTHSHYTRFSSLFINGCVIYPWNGCRYGGIVNIMCEEKHAGSTMTSSTTAKKKWLAGINIMLDRCYIHDYGIVWIRRIRKLSKRCSF